MKYHALFFSKIGKNLQNLSSAAVVIGVLNASCHEKTSHSNCDYCNRHWSKGYKTFFMLIPNEHEIYPHDKYKVLKQEKSSFFSILAFI